MQQRNNLKINNENENEKENDKKDEIAGKAKPKSFTVKWISKFIPINGKIILDRSFSESSKYNVLLKNNDAEDKNIFQFDNEDQSKKNQNGKDEKNLFVVSKWDYGNPFHSKRFRFSLPRNFIFFFIFFFIFIFIIDF